MSLPLLTQHSKSQKTESRPLFLALLLLPGQATGLAHGPRLRDEAKPGHIPGPAACQQAPQSLAVDGELSSSFVPTIFFLGFKGYLQPSCLNLTWKNSMERDEYGVQREDLNC